MYHLILNITFLIIIFVLLNNKYMLRLRNGSIANQSSFSCFIVLRKKPYDYYLYLPYYYIYYSLCLGTAP